MKFEIVFDGWVTLDEKDVWPDGDAPEEPTAEDVKAVMERCGMKSTVLREWDLLQDIEVTVSEQGKNHQRVWR